METKPTIPGSQQFLARYSPGSQKTQKKPETKDIVSLMEPVNATIIFDWFFGYVDFQG
jgi:hypothetical protein